MIFAQSANDILDCPFAHLQPLECQFSSQLFDPHWLAARGTHHPLGNDSLARGELETGKRIVEGELWLRGCHLLTNKPLRCQRQQRLTILRALPDLLGNGFTD